MVKKAGFSVNANTEADEMAMDLVTDSTFLLYCWLFIVEVYLFGLFLAEWIRIGRATTVFAFWTILFGAMAIRAGVTTYARCMSHIDYDRYTEFLTSTHWATRNILVAITLTIIAIYFTRRTIRRRRGEISEPG